MALGSSLAVRPPFLSTPRQSLHTVRASRSQLRIFALVCSILSSHSFFCLSTCFGHGILLPALSLLLLGSFTFARDAAAGFSFLLTSLDGVTTPNSCQRDQVSWMVGKSSGCRATRCIFLSTASLSPLSFFLSHLYACVRCSRRRCLVVAVQSVKIART